MKEAIKKLLDMSVGELREQLAYDDGDESIQEVFEDMFEHELDNGQSLEDYLNENYGAENDQYDDDDNEDDDYSYDDEDDCSYDDDDDDDDYDYDDDDEEPDTANTDGLTPEEKALADQIIDDIDNGVYKIKSIKGVYSDKMYNYIYKMVD